MLILARVNRGAAAVGVGVVAFGACCLAIGYYSGHG